VQARKPTPHATGLHCYRWATFVGRMKDNEVWSLGPDVTLSFEGSSSISVQTDGSHWV